MIFDGQSGGTVVVALTLLAAAIAILWQHSRLKTAQRAATESRQAAADMDWAYTTAPLGLAMFDKDLRYIKVNQRLADFNGQSIEHHIGKTIQDIVPDVVPQADEPFRQVLRTGVPLLGIVFESATAADPGVVRSWRESVYPIFSDKKEVIGLNVAVEEVTEERRLSAALGSSEQRERERAAELEAIMNATPAGIFIAHDVECLHIAGNPEAYRMLRLSPGSNVSADPRNPSELGVFTGTGGDTPVPACQLPMQVAAATGEAVHGADLKYRLKDGTEIHVLINAAPLRDEHGKVFGAVGAMIDVTAQKKAEEALQQDSRRKDEFLATLAHELRNPLAAIQSGLDMSRLSPSGAPSLKPVHGIMERQLAHLTRLIDDLLDVSRISSGKFELRKENLDLRTVIEDALDVSRPYVESCGHRLNVSLPSTPLHMDGDSVRLTQVVNNLLNNAAKYTPEGGVITLALEQQAGDVVIQVIDNGIGIDSELLPQLFNIYSQLEQGKDRRQGGIGIGLSLAKRIVELHGGSLSAQSAGSGKGSTFSVRLPLRASMEGDAITSPSTQGSSSERKRILIVDDNHDAAQTLAALLGLGGHVIELAYTGHEAMEAAANFDPDIAFIDIGLPDMSGYELARFLRAAPAFKHARLLALTGWGSEKDRRASLASGFDFHITKPATIEVIKSVLPDLHMPALQ